MGCVGTIAIAVASFEKLQKMLHVMTFVRQSTTGMAIAVFKPSVPPILPTPERLLDAILETKTTVLFCVPSIIEVSSPSFHM